MRADGVTQLVLTNAQRQAIEAAFSINTPNPNTNTNDGSINWTYSIDESDLNFLAHGETVTAVFSITIDDSNGTTPSQDITITITGDNDQTTISSGDDSVGVRETNSSISSTGTITVTDLDVTDTVDLSVQNVVITGGDYTSQTVPAALTANSNQALLDMLSLTPAAGNELTADPDSGSTFSWTFTSGDSGDSAFNFLAKDETLQLTYTIQSTDNSRGTQQHNNQHHHCSRHRHRYQRHSLISPLPMKPAPSQKTPTHLHLVQPPLRSIPSLSPALTKQATPSPPPSTTLKSPTSLHQRQPSIA